MGVYKVEIGYSVTPVNEIGVKKKAIFPILIRTNLK